jgi:hypothetical protein
VNRLVRGFFRGHHDEDSVLNRHAKDQRNSLKQAARTTVRLFDRASEEEPALSLIKTLVIVATG